jgi:hypothetical protein
MSLSLSRKCKKCGVNSSHFYRWCKPCQIDSLKENFINWTSENEKIDKFIQKKQLEVGHPQDFVIEWIPYDQFDKIEEINKSNFFTMYSAIWKNGPLYWDRYDMKYIRNSDTKVALKCLYNSENIDDFLNEV